MSDRSEEIRCPRCLRFYQRTEPCPYCAALQPLQPGETAIRRAEHNHDEGGIFNTPLRPDYQEPWTSEHQKRYDRTLRVRDPHEKG